MQKIAPLFFASNCLTSQILVSHAIFPSLVLRGSRGRVTRVSFSIAVPSIDRSIRDEPYCLAQVAFFANWREREDTSLLFARSRHVYARVSLPIDDPIHQYIMSARVRQPRARPRPRRDDVQRPGSFIFSLFLFLVMRKTSAASIADNF